MTEHNSETVDIVDHLEVVGSRMDMAIEHDLESLGQVLRSLEENVTAREELIGPTSDTAAYARTVLNRLGLSVLNES